MRGRRTRLTLRGATLLLGAVGCWVAAFGLGLPELVYAAALLAGLMIASFVYARLGTGRITVRRRLGAATTIVGESLAIELVVDGSVRYEGDWRDSVPASLRARARGSIAELHSGAGYDIAPERRGEYTLGPLRIAARDPFGLWKQDTQTAGTDALVVFPAVHDLPEIGFGRHGSGDQRPTSSGGDIRTAPDPMPREYREGDPMSRVHWKATARRGVLMVRDDEPETDRVAVVVLDLRHGGGEAVDRAATMVGSVAVHFQELGFHVRIISVGASPAIDVTVERIVDWSETLHALARVQPDFQAREPVHPDGLVTVLIGPSPRPWRSRTHERLAIVTERLSSGARSELERDGWHLADYGDEGSALAAWSTLRASIDQRAGCG